MKWYGILTTNTDSYWWLVLLYITLNWDYLAFILVLFEQIIVHDGCIININFVEVSSKICWNRSSVLRAKEEGVAAHWRF
jgi:hypothetical protein